MTAEKGLSFIPQS